MPVMSRLVNGSTRSFGQRGAVESVDPYFKYVTMLLSTSSLTNADNSRFLDSSSSYTPISRTGNVSQGSFSPYDPNWSNYFDGTGDYLDIAANAAFNLSGDFTIEFWINTTQTTNSWITGFYNSNPDFTSQVGYLVAISSGNYLLSLNSGSTETTFTIGTASSISNGAWHHIACTRSGNTVRTFLDGVLATTTTYSSTLNNPAGSIYRVGGLSGKFEAPFTGYISNLRIVKGTAVYTGNFTPPTSPLTAISGTSLLLCQSNRLRDASTNNFTITKNGDTSVSPFSPFTFSKPGAVYNQNDISNYSVFFDGSSYLSAPDSSNYTLGSGSFVFETFVNFTSLPANGGAATFLAQWYDGTLGWWFYLYNNAGTYQLIFSYSTNGSNQTNVLVNLSAAPTLNTWNHVSFYHFSGFGLGIFWNGVQIGTFQTIGATIFDANSAIQIGARVGSGGAGYYLNGYMSNMRLTRDASGSWLWPPTSKVPTRSGTVLLALQDSVFSDNSTTKAIFTPVGNPRITGANPFQAGYYSTYHSGGANYLSVAAATAIDLASSDFTIEAWVFPGTQTNAVDAVFGYGVYSTMLYRNGTTWTWEVGNGSSANYFTITATCTPNRWQHVALTRSGNTFTFWLNGVSAGTNTTSNAVGTASKNLAIGYNNSSTQYFTGNISNFRIVKGTAVYTTAFTPSTTPLTAISGTSLLTCQSNRFLDNSTNAFTITPTGSPVVQTRNPFYTAVVGSAGGSAYFDGNGDWLSLADSPDWDFTGDFTVEAWVYPLTGGANRTIMSTYASPSSGWMLRTDAGTALNFTWGDSLIVGTTAPLTLNAWNHVAATRSGTTARMFLNGALVATATDSTNLTNSSPLYIGTLNTANLGWMMNGYMAGMRIVKGSALYTAAFTPPTAPLTPDGNTTLLVNGMNAGIYDATAQNDLETLGDAKVSSVQAKYGSTSIALDGTGDYLSVGPTGNLHSFGTADFTIEAWVYVNSISTYGGIIDARSGATQSNYAMGVWSNSGNKLDFLYGATRLTSAATFSTGQWVHFAVTRASGTIRLFINGVVDTNTATYTSAIDSNRTQPLIGAVQDPYYLNGYIDDLRITKGYARYTATFTPPTKALPVR